MTEMISVVTLTFLLSQLFNIKLALVLAFINQVVRNLNGLVRMENRILVLVNLTKQSTNLHMSFASIFKHF